MQAQLWTISGLATELEQDRKALARRLEGLEPDESTTDKRRRVTRSYRMAKVVQFLFGGQDAGEFDNQRDRLAAAQAEKYELENALRRGQVAELGAIAEVVSNANAAVRAKLLSMPSKLGAQLVNISDANILAGRIKVEIHAALAELADYTARLPADEDGLADGGDEGLQAAAVPDGQRVGRRKKAPKQRVERGAGTVAN